MRRNLITFIVLIGATAVALYTFNLARFYAALQTDGIHTSAKIESVECRKSVNFEYSFAARGDVHNGRGGSIEKCINFKVGDVVQVTYLASDPTQNFYGDPAAALTNCILMSVLGISLTSGLLIRLYIRRKSA